MPAVVVLLFSAVLLHVYDISWLDILAYAAYFAGVIVIPGTLLWRWLRPFTSLSRFEDLVMGAIVGLALEIPTYCLARWLGHPHWYVLAQAAIIGAALVSKSRRELWLPQRPHLDRRAAWALAGICCYATLWLGHKMFAITAMTTQNMSNGYVDEPYQLAMIGELKNHFPPVVPYVLDQPLLYHWFVYAHFAGGSWTTGLDGVELFRRLTPLALTLIVTLGTATLAMRLTRKAWPGVVASALLVLVGGFDLSGIGHGEAQLEERFLNSTIVFSPTQTFGTVIVIGTVLVLLDILRSDRVTIRSATALGGLLLALSGAKATFIPILAAGLAVAWLLQLVTTRRFPRASGVALVVALAALAFAQLVLFQGVSQGLGWNPFESSVILANWLSFGSSTGDRATITLIMLVQWLLVGVGAVGLYVRGRWRDPEAIFLAGCVLAAYGGMFAFAQWANSQSYFGRSAAVFVVVLSAWGCSVLAPDPLPARLAYRLLGAAFTAGATTWLIRQWTEHLHEALKDGSGHAVGLAVNPVALLLLAVGLLSARILLRARGSRRAVSGILAISVFLGLGLARSISLVVDVATSHQEATPAFEKAPIAPGGIAAAQWLRDHSTPDDVVATNAHCRVAGEPTCDNRKFWVAGYTERRVVMEGWGYIPQTNSDLPVGGDPTFSGTFDPHRLAVNDAVFQNPSEHTLASLSSQYNVKWVFVDEAYSSDLPGLEQLHGLELVFEEPGFAIFRVSDE